MKNLIYIEENYITPEECEEFIKLSKDNQKPIPYGDPTRGGDTYLTNVEWKNHGSSYHGGDIDVSLTDTSKAHWYMEKLMQYLNDLKKNGGVIDKVNNVEELFKEKK